MRKILFTLLSTLALSLPLQAQENALPRIIRKSGGVLQQQATKRVQPAYPPLARAAKISGPVIVEVTIDETGRVIAARVISGHPLLRDAVIAAVKQWEWLPTKLSGVPVKVIGTITFNFTLDSNVPPIKGLAELEAEARRNPDSAEARYKLGEAYCNSRKYAEAELREAIRIKPEYAEARYKLGLALSGLKRHAEAIEHFKEAAALRPDYTEAFVALGLAYAETEQYEDALEALRKGKELAPQIAQIHLYLAVTYGLMGLREEALTSLRDALAVDPIDPETLHRLGLIYFQMGDRKTAMDVYKRLKKIDEQLASELLREIGR